MEYNYVCVDKLPVDELPANTSFEEPAAPIAGEYTVVFPAGRVPAYDTGEPGGTGSLHDTST